MKPKIEIDLKEVERLAGLGLNRRQIADALGISSTTFYERKKESEEIEQAIKKGKAKAVGLVSNALFEKAMNGDTTSMIFFLKSVGGFVETQKQIISDESKPAESEGLADVYRRMASAQRGK